MRMNSPWTIDRPMMADPNAARETRVSKLLPLEVSSERHGRVRFVVRNISPYGIGGRGELELLPCERVTIHLPGDRQIGATVRWVRKNTFGFALDEPIDPTELQAKASTNGNLTPRDATQEFNVYKHSPSIHRPGFQRSHRDQVLLGASHWKTD